MNHAGPIRQCIYCEQLWPCDTAILIAAYEELENELAKRDKVQPL